MTCSFLLTTYNKLETLKVILNNFLNNKIPNTEIIISDGFSTDGTVEYLKDLKEKNLIEGLILSNEKDLGEWHGYKKTLNLASGKYIKFITDDDAFDYSAINECINFLCKHEEVDWLNSEGFSKQFGVLYHSGYHKVIKEKNSTNPKVNGLNEGLCGLGLFIKREVSYSLDLFNDNYGARTDKQLSLELVNSKFKGASTNMVTWVRILNAKSNTLLYGGSLENKNILEVNKKFKIDGVMFTHEVDDNTLMLKNVNSNNNKEFLIF
jgi:glycosyltransferase involved in cell wall biosynthesis